MLSSCAARLVATSRKPDGKPCYPMVLKKDNNCGLRPYVSYSQYQLVVSEGSHMHAEIHDVECMCCAIYAKEI